MDPTNSRGRSKFLACFKPFVDGDDETGRDSASPPSSGDESGGRRKKRGRRSFSVTMKAVFCKTSPLRKSRSESSKQDLERRQSSNLLSKSKKLIRSVKKSLSCKSFWEPELLIFRTSSDRSSFFSSNSSRRVASSMSSSSISSLSSNTRSDSDAIVRSDSSLDFRQIRPVMIKSQKSVKKSVCVGKCIYNRTLDRMCILLVCLVGLVFWGKVFAIATCTSTWLLFAPAGRRGHRLGRAESPVNDVIVDSEEYKKRVIMGGLLERNRSRDISVVNL